MVTLGDSRPVRRALGAAGRTPWWTAGWIPGRAASAAVLADLQLRALAHAALPDLPAGWQVEADMRSARDGSFCGDFLLASQRTPGRLDLVLVDVSGNGRQAAPRALLFTAALGSLLDAVPDSDFLAAANHYLLRHGGEDGFATAVHLGIQTSEGTFRVSSAGHPPAAHFRAGSGRWEMLRGGGPVLGVVPDAEFEATEGVLGTGDAVLLYTDGLVESRRLDVARGIDRLIGSADSVISRGSPRAAAVIAAATGVDSTDDRSLVVVRRGDPPRRDVPQARTS